MISTPEKPWPTLGNESNRRDNGPHNLLNWKKAQNNRRLSGAKNTALFALFQLYIAPLYTEIKFVIKYKENT
jgi:hypothetical protein